MALRDQPYFPLYVQDYLTDEKLNNCSASSQGIYIKIMCLFHKCDPYGGILLKQNDKQSENICFNFARKLSKQLPFDSIEINEALIELLHEKVLLIDGDFLFQKRMVKDNDISNKRSEIGSKGGKKTQNKNKNFAKAKSKANSEYENEYENVVIVPSFTTKFSSKFLNVWYELIGMPKWKKKPTTAIQKSLTQLERYEELFAIGLVEKAIAGNYQGVVFSNTDAEYVNWKNKSNGGKQQQRSVSERTNELDGIVSSVFASKGM